MTGGGGRRTHAHMRRLLCLLLIALCWAAPATAARRPCTPASATRTTIETVRADYPAWAGRCVALRGIADGNRLLADRHALLERRPGFGDEIRRSIVLYRLRRLPRIASPRRVEVIGRVGSCADQNATVEAMRTEAPDQIIMVSGYCHTSLETYVEPVAIRTLSRAAIPRLTEAEVPVGARELVAVSEGLPGLAPNLAAARAMATALASGDRVAFGRLRDPDVHADQAKLGGAPTPEWIIRRQREIDDAFRDLGDVRRRFAALPNGTARQELLLVDRRDLAEREDGEFPALTVCWCRTADCAGRWPVRRADADNQGDRPYLCTTATDYLLGPRAGKAIQVDVVDGRNGFAEPAWPAPAPSPG